MIEGLYALAPLLAAGSFLALAFLPLLAYSLGWASGMLVRRASFGFFGNLIVGIAGLAVGFLLDTILHGAAIAYDLPSPGAWTFYPCILVAGPLVVALPLRSRRSP